MTRLVVALLAIALVAAPAAAQEREHGFADLYGGVAGLLESDVRAWDFADASTTVGGRLGVWLGERWGLAFRTWYFQTDAKERVGASPSDLAFLGLALELFARWPLDERWTLYGALGPAVAVTTLDRSRRVDGAIVEEDARGVGPGGSGSVGIQARVAGPFSAFAELQTTLVYPELSFQGQTITPRLLTVHGLMGVRVRF
ncbi:MAG TPA: outer membrane beta-barrel protein [Candidatus Tectomicrobia bacterium]|nr:outer membrane beta-barrel protein [Candidatus Tectomicrobia bacterium]